MKWGRSHSLVALVLAIGVSGAILVLAAAAGVAEAAKNRTISAEAATLLSTTLGAAIGAVATYLGSHSAGGEETPAPEEEESEQPTREWPSS